VHGEESATGCLRPPVCISFPIDASPFALHVSSCYDIPAGSLGGQAARGKAELSEQTVAERPMKFVEMTGKRLAELINDGELHAADLESAGITSDTIVRINEQGDIEVRRTTCWDVVGGLLGEYRERIRRITGMEWA
jgi:hypothetical protein